MIRQLLGRTVVVALLASTQLVAPAASADDPVDEPVITFIGGGFGHGIGMSQYGALGRAEAGHTYDEILRHYYAETTLETVTDYPGFETEDDVDVRLDVRSSVTISMPDSQADTWAVEVKAGGDLIGSATKPVNATWDVSHWHAMVDGVDLCVGNESSCADGDMSIVLSGSERAVLRTSEVGSVLGEYAHGAITLHPAAVETAKGLPLRCGAAFANDFCVIHADLDFQDYLYGLAEVPASWPDEALKTQAVAGRSYAAATMTSRAASSGWPEPFDLYDSTQDQNYTGWAKESECESFEWCAAVDATDDEVVVHDGKIATTFYSSSNGGYSASPVDVWDNGTASPYLTPAPDPFDDNDSNPNGSWEITYTLADVSRWLNNYSAGQGDPTDQTHVGDVQQISIENVPPSGRTNYATVTISGSKKTEEITRDGEPYGYRLFFALRQGCEADPGCVQLITTKFFIISFADVNFSDYFYTPVVWMTLNNLTTGVAPNMFAPEQPNTRAQLATFLWRFADEPDATVPSKFEDVAVGSFYETAVAWMAESKITTGTAPTEFSPEKTVSRAEAATFLWRFAGEPEPTVDAGFDDVESGRYYTDAVRWMVEWDITTGTSPTEFSPSDPLTRGQIATFLWRLAGAPGAFADGVELPNSMRDG